MKAKSILLASMILITHSNAYAQEWRLYSINSISGVFKNIGDTYQENLERRNKCGSIRIAISLWHVSSKLFPVRSEDVAMVEAGQCGPEMQRLLKGVEYPDDPSSSKTDTRKSSGIGDAVKSIAALTGVVAGTVIGVNLVRAGADADWIQLINADRIAPSPSLKSDIAARFIIVADDLANNPQYSHKTDYIANGYSTAAYYYAQSYKQTGDDEMLYLARRLVERALSYSVNNCSSYMALQVASLSSDSEEITASLVNHLISQNNEISCQINDVGWGVRGPGYGVNLKYQPKPAALAAFTKLSEKYQWEIVLSHKDEQIINLYLSNYPQGSFTRQANNLLEDIVWGRSVDENSLREYLSLYPNGRYFTDANNRLEDIYWTSISAAKNADSYRQYLSSYPKGRYVRDAKARIESILFNGMLRRREGLGIYLGGFTAGTPSGQIGLDYSTMFGKNETYLSYGVNLGYSPKFNFAVGYNYWLNRKISVGAGADYDHELTLTQNDKESEVGTANGSWGIFAQVNAAFGDSLTLGGRYRKGLCLTDGCTNAANKFGVVVGYKF